MLKASSLHIFLLYFIAHLAAPYLNAQMVPKVMQFNRTDYEADDQNWMIEQDCEGNIYVANSEAILIYNGISWQKVRLPKNKKPRSVFRGQDCRMYVGAHETFGYIDRSNKLFSKYIPVADSILLGGNQEIWNIIGIRESLYFQSFSNLYKYDYDKIEELKIPSNIMFGAGINEEVYIPKIEEGVYKVENDNVAALNLGAALPSRCKIAGLCEWNNDEGVVLGTQFNGIIIWQQGRLRSINSELNELLKTEQINKIIRLSSGEYVIGTILNGIYITKDFINIKYHIHKSNGLSNNTVLSLFEDRDKNLWVGLDKGINLIKVSQPIAYYYDRKGKLGTVFTAIHFENDLYLGTNQGVFKSQSNGSFELIKDSQGQIWSFLISNDELICGHNKGTFLIENDQFIQISDITGGWHMEQIDERTILQSTYTGLILLSRESDGWHIKHKVKNGQIQFEKFIRDGHQILGYHSTLGLSIVQLSSDFGQVIAERKLPEFDNHLRGSLPKFFNASQEAVIGIADKYYQLQNDSLIEVAADKFSNDLHFSTQQKYYDVLKTLEDTEQLTNSFFFDPLKTDADYYIGMDEGFLAYPKNKISKKAAQSAAKIDYISVNGKLLRDSAELLLSANENNIIFTLANFRFEEKTPKGFYKLQNWDDKWHAIPTSGKLNFVNLQDRKYNLILATSAKIPITSFPFEIESHWYESWIGALIFAFLAFLIFSFINRRNKRKLKLQNERLLLEKAKELESERIRSSNEKLRRDVKYKSKMLANSTMALVQKNKILAQLKEVILQEDFAQLKVNQYKRKVIHLIDRNINNEEDWEIFEKNFAEVHQDFLEKLKAQYPTITAGELKLAAYIRMSLSSKEIAPLLNISLRSVENKRYRLRKKMGIPHEGNLSEHLLRL